MFRSPFGQERDEQSSLLPKNGLSPHENHSYGAWNAAHEDGRRSESAVMHSMSAPSSTGIPDDGTHAYLRIIRFMELGSQIGCRYLFIYLFPIVFPEESGLSTFGHSFFCH